MGLNIAEIVVYLLILTGKPLRLKLRSRPVVWERLGSPGGLRPTLRLCKSYMQSATAVETGLRERKLRTGRFPGSC